MTPVTLFSTVTLFLPDRGPHPAVPGFVTPDPATCKVKARPLERDSDAVRTFRHVCRERA